MKKTELTIRPMTMADYDAAMALWETTPGICIRDVDSRDAIARYLARNPGLSLVAVASGSVVGTVLCGHDGRRGFIHHLAVKEGHRRKGIGRALFDRCVEGLEREGILKTHLFVLNENEGAFAFWEKSGCRKRDDIATFTHNRSVNPHS